MVKPNENWKHGLHYSAFSDIGMRRLKNQDAHLELPADNEATWQSRGHLFIVADGMGAHAAGELASKQAVEGIAHLYTKYVDRAPTAAILQAVHDTNGDIHRRGRANVEFYNMGTTCSSLLLLPEGAYIAHVGDSRVYRLRGGELQQLTFDHSLVWEMRAAGHLSGSDARLAIPKNVITRSLGPQPQVQVDLEGGFPVQAGDAFLLCSDGLTGRVEDAEIAFVLDHLPPAEAGQFLVDLTNLRGGPDNITVVIVQVGERVPRTGSPSPASSAPTAPSLPHALGVRLIPSLWIALGLVLAAAVGLLLTASFLLGWMMLGVASMIGVALAMLATRNTRPKPSSETPPHLGRAPYGKSRGISAQDFQDEFRALVERILLILEEDGDFPRASVDAQLKQIAHRFASENISDALRLQAALARELMDAIRAQVDSGNSLE